MKKAEEVDYPICPMNRYFESDIDKCNPDLCDWDVDGRFCFEGCKRIKNKDIQK